MKQTGLVAWVDMNGIRLVSEHRYVGKCKRERHTPGLAYIGPFAFKQASKKKKNCPKIFIFK